MSLLLLVIMDYILIFSLFVCKPQDGIKVSFPAINYLSELFRLSHAFFGFVSSFETHKDLMAAAAAMPRISITIFQNRCPLCCHFHCRHAYTEKACNVRMFIDNEDTTQSWSVLIYFVHPNKISRKIYLVVESNV